HDEVPARPRDAARHRTVPIGLASERSDRAGAAHVARRSTDRRDRSRAGVHRSESLPPCLSRACRGLPGHVSGLTARTYKTTARVVLDAWRVDRRASRGVMEQFVAIAVAHFLALLIPGVDFFLIARTAMTSGWRNASGACL